MKNILFIAPNVGNWGGSEILWFKTAQYCTDRGIKVGIAINECKPMPKQIDEIIAAGKVEMVYRRLRLTLKERLANRLVPQQYKYDLWKEFKKRILAWKPDFAVISQGDNREGTELMNFLADYKINYVTISQAAIDYVWPSVEYGSLMGRGYKNALSNYFVSKANLQLTEMQIGASLPNGKVINNPFNVPFNTELPYPDRRNGFKLACVGRYEIGNKGQDVLLRVLNEKKWRERDIFITFYGSGRHRASIQNLITHFMLNNAVLGDYLDTINIWRLNHALVMPTRFEGLPLALVEAMLCGRFGIVTNVSGNKEVIKDNINGFIAEAPQVEYVDAALERAWAERENWEEIGKNAKSYIRTLVPEDPIQEFFNELKLFL
jgi:glycosyltransferase involved in cell wall biosynthesis